MFYYLSVNQHLIITFSHIQSQKKGFLLLLQGLDQAAYVPTRNFMNQREEIEASSSLNHSHKILHIN